MNFVPSQYGGYMPMSNMPLTRHIYAMGRRPSHRRPSHRRPSHRRPKRGKGIGSTILQNLKDLAGPVASALKDSLALGLAQKFGQVDPALGRLAQRGVTELGNKIGIGRRRRGVGRPRSVARPSLSRTKRKVGGYMLAGGARRRRGRGLLSSLLGGVGTGINRGLAGLFGGRRSLARPSLARPSLSRTKRKVGGANYAGFPPGFRPGILMSTGGRHRHSHHRRGGLMHKRVVHKRKLGKGILDFLL